MKIILNNEQAKKLVKEAINARNFAYAPYSNFLVGAALLTKLGKIYTGCNIESSVYTPTCCAERTAFFKAVSEGERNFEAIAIVGGKVDEEIQKNCPPCGVCLQVMTAFCNPHEFEIILAKSLGNFEIFKLKDLLPIAFCNENLN